MVSTDFSVTWLTNKILWNLSPRLSFPSIWARHDKTNKVTVRPAKTQISLDIRPVWSDFAVRKKKAWVLSYPLSAERRLWSDWADAQADLSLRWAHSHIVSFVMSRLIPKLADSVCANELGYMTSSEPPLTFRHEKSTNCRYSSLLWNCFKQKCIASIDTFVPSKMKSTRFSQAGCNRDIRRLSGRGHSRKHLLPRNSRTGITTRRSRKKPSKHVEGPMMTTSAPW